MKIAEFLANGRENARTARQLAEMTGCDARAITIQIEKERREGAPICAACGERPGYFIAETAEELQAYCDQLKSRGMEIFKTRQALIKVLRQYGEAKANGEK